MTVEGRPVADVRDVACIASSTVDGDAEGARTLDGLVTRLRAFADERDWAQFHTPKNLVMALSGEVGELTALFQWLTPDQSAHAMAAGERARVEDELADVVLYMASLADVLGVDLLEVAYAKIERNGERYPVELSRGRPDKYTKLANR